MQRRSLLGRAKNSNSHLGKKVRRVRKTWSTKVGFKLYNQPYNIHDMDNASYHNALRLRIFQDKLHGQSKPSDTLGPPHSLQVRPYSSSNSTVVSVMCAKLRVLHRRKSFRAEYSYIIYFIMFVAVFDQLTSNAGCRLLNLYRNILSLF